MKSKLTSFADMALSREQMKALKGGCLICSTGGPNTPGYPPSGSCGEVGSGGAAMAEELNASGDGYKYTASGPDC